MICYLAGSPSLVQLEKAAEKAKANNFLFTFAQSGARQCAKHFAKQPNRRLFIDSGAFSIWSNGAEVDFKAYLEFCKNILATARCKIVFAALDVIPGKKDGPNPTQSEIALAADEGWANYKAMKQEGVPCLMTFHQFEHRRVLKRILEDSDYFAVAPRKDANAQSREEWLRALFRYLHGDEHFAPTDKKIHGLGISSAVWLQEFPFYSVDSTAWLQSVRSHSRAQMSDGGFRVSYRRLSDWEKLAKQCGMPTKYLQEMLGYGKRGEKADPEGRSGDYWLLYLAMDAYVEAERKITEFWRHKGVVWEDAHIATEVAL
jgi:hypothetical protein